MKRRHYLSLAGVTTITGCLGSASSSPKETETADTEETDGTNDASTIKAKVDLHSHVFEGGGQDMADRYAELGFDVLVGTDHSYDVGLHGHVEAEQVADYSDLDFPGPILNGMEASADHHVNIIKSESEMIKQINHPMRYDDTAADINYLAEKIGADLVEITNHGKKLSEYPSLVDAIEDLDPDPTITSDAHAPDEIGAGYVTVEVEELTGDHVIRALKRGDYSLGGSLW